LLSSSAYLATFPEERVPDLTIGVAIARTCGEKAGHTVDCTFQHKRIFGAVVL
jgi:hypothetical protein